MGVNSHKSKVKDTITCIGLSENKSRSDFELIIDRDLQKQT